MKIVSHCYIKNDIYDISNVRGGTTKLYKEFYNKRINKALFCGVLYMAEDILALSDGFAEIYLPEVKIGSNKILQPRCPMEFQIDIEDIKKYRKQFDIMLAYINTPSQIKAICDGVYNGTEAIRIFYEFDKQYSKKICLVGDKNVNWWITQEFRDMQLIHKLKTFPQNVYCPPHNKLSLTKLKNFIKKYCKKDNDFCTQFHSESNKDVLSYAMKKNSYIGGTTGMIYNINRKPNVKWIIPTIDNYIKNVKSETNVDIISPVMSCLSMNYTTLDKVKKAKKLLDNYGYVAELLISDDYPYFDLKILMEQYIKRFNEQLIIPAVKLSLTNKLSATLKNRLSYIIN